MEPSGSRSVDLAGAGTKLASNRRARALLRTRLAESEFEGAIASLRAGDFNGELGARVHDILHDEIHDNATEYWIGTIGGKLSGHPVRVCGYGGVYLIWAMDWGVFGYFLSREDAVSFVRFHWDDVSGGYVRR